MKNHTSHPNRNLNQNADTKNFHRANQKRRFPSQRQYESRQPVYIVPDSCILIDIEKLNLGKTERLNHEYIHNLKTLLRITKKFSDDRYSRGQVIMLLMPATHKELSNYQGRFHNVIAKVLREHVLTVEIDDFYINEFTELENKLVNAYISQGLFTNTQKMDARLVAESSIFNIPVLSQDNHIIGRGNGKLEKIKEINESILGFYQHQASPVKIKTLLSRIAKNRPSPEPDNFVYFSNNTQQALKQANNGKIKIGFHYEEKKHE